MFLEMFKPRLIDINSTRDRVKIRIGEEHSKGQFWMNLVFENEDQFKKFQKSIAEIDLRKWVEERTRLSI